MIKRKTHRHTGFIPAVCLVILAAVSWATATGCKKQNDDLSISTTTSTAVQTTSAATTTTETTTATTTFATAEIPDQLPPYGWCIASSLHVRKTPNTYFEAIGGLKYGEKVTIIGREGDWYKIKFKDGEAYVKAEYISPTEVFATEADQTDFTTANP